MDKFETMPGQTVATLFSSLLSKSSDNVEAISTRLKCDNIDSVFTEIMFKQSQTVATFYQRSPEIC